jgi:outer membrane receptor protein involved in Fe transport
MFSSTPFPLKWIPLLIATTALPMAPALSAQEATEETIYELSAFEVSADTTRGYLATNTLSATGFNAENFKIPLGISVATEAFLDDIAATDLSDTTYYLAGVTTGEWGPGDRQGANYHIRGFQAAWQNRNGLRVYNISGTDNVARFEVLKGPSSVFYGEAAPGGIVNYVTKRASFVPNHSVTFETNSEGRMKGTLETEGPLKVLGKDDWLAYRFMVSHEDDQTWRDFEYRNKLFYFGGLRIRPLEGLDIFVEFEKTREDYNYGRNVPMGNRDYMADWADPPQELLDYILTVDRRANPDNVRDRAQLRWLDIVAWQSDNKAVYGVMPPKYVDFMPEATPYGHKWNIHGPGGGVDMDIEVKTIDIQYRALDWLHLRAAVTEWDRIMTSLESLRYHVRGDGSIDVEPVMGFGFGLLNLTRQTNLEALLSGDFWGTSHNLVLGFGQFEQEFHPLTYRFKPFSEQPEWFRGAWDPYDEPYFDLRDTLDDPNAYKSSGSRGRDRNYYVSWNGQWFDGKLFTLAGLRMQQLQDTFTNPEGDPLAVGPEFEEMSPMLGLSFEFMKGLSVFGSYSRSARPGPGAMVQGTGVTPEEMGKPGPPGIGEGYDFGFKANIRDNFISGSLNFFRVISSNETKVRDNERTDADPRNLDEDTNNNVVWSRPAGERTSEGVELEFVFTPSENYQLLFNYTWLATAEITDDPTNPELNGARMGIAPEHTFGFWNKYEFTEGMLEGFSMGLGAKYMGSYSAQGPTSPNQYEMDAFLIFDMMLRYGFDWREHQIDLTLNIQNLLDEDYYVRPAAHPGDPIRASLTVKLTY